MREIASFVKGGNLIFSFLKRNWFLLTMILTLKLFDMQTKHGVQHRMISVDNFFCIFEIIIFCFVVAICDLVHAVEVMYSLP